MNKIFFLLLIAVQFPILAMPPHPDADGLVNREHRPIEPGIVLNKSSSFDSTRMMSSPLATGTVKVLVLLVGYGAEQAYFPVMNKKTNPFLFLLLLPLLLPFLFPGKKRLILLSASVFLITVSCPNNTISVDYGDKMLFQTPASVYDEILETGSGLTMKKYYLDMSDNNLDLDFDIKGPYNAPYGWQYYGKNDSNDFDMYPGELVGFAVPAAEKDGVDFSQYDNEGNGFVDTVIVLHAGQGEETGADPDTIWSHNWTLSGAASYGDGTGSRDYDGKIINNYTIQPEYSKNPGEPTIGVFCHEFGHVLGLPDLYDTIPDKNNPTNGVGDWSLMSGGSWGSGNGSDPAPLLAWERYDISGDDSWITLTEKNTDTTISIDNIE